MHPPPEVRTPAVLLLGTTTGMILTAVAAIAGLALLLGAVYLADSPPDAIRRKARRDGGASGTGHAGEISAGQRPRPWERIEDRHVPEGGHPHGKPASWMLVVPIITGFIAGGAATITHTWWLLWTCAATVVLAVPAGKVIGITDDAVAWGSTAVEAASDAPRGPEAYRAQDQPPLPGSDEPGVRHQA